MPKKDVTKNSRGRPRKLFERNIEADRKVDKYHLDDAAEEQADAYGYWSDLAPKAKKKLENKELALDILIGEKYGFYKESLDGGVDSKGKAKAPTDTAVNSAIAADGDVIEVKRELIDLREFYGLINSAIKTMEQRRSSIKVLNELHSNKYFDMAAREEDSYNAKEIKKQKKKNAKKSVGEGLSNLDIEEDDEAQDDVVEVGEAEVTIENAAPEDVVVTTSNEDDSDDSDDIVSEEDDEETDSEDVSEDVSDSEDDKTDDADEETTEDLPGNGCPFKHKFGEFGEYDDCDDCDNESACFRRSKEI